MAYITLNCRTSVESEGDGFISQGFEMPQDEASRKKLAANIFEMYTKADQEKIISATKEAPGIGMALAAFKDLGVGDDKDIGIMAVDLRLQRLIKQAELAQK